MAKKIVKAVKKVCLAFVMLYGLNLILAGANIFVPINIITIILVSFLGTPGILGLVAAYFII